MKVNGVCQVVYEKDTRKGKMYSVCVQVDGSDMWFGCGSKKPTHITKGDTVEFTGEKGNNGFWEVVSDITKVSTAPAASTKGGGGGGWNDPARQKSIVAQSSIKSALDFVTLALSADALVLGTPAAKAPKKFDALEAIIKEKATEFYNIALDPDSYFEVEDEDDLEDDFNPVPE
jgi:hypothetical protein